MRNNLVVLGALIDICYLEFESQVQAIQVQYQTIYGSSIPLFDELILQCLESLGLSFDSSSLASLSHQLLSLHQDLAGLPEKITTAFEREKIIDICYELVSMVSSFIPSMNCLLSASMISTALKGHESIPETSSEEQDKIFLLSIYAQEFIKRLIEIDSVLVSQFGGSGGRLLNACINIFCHRLCLSTLENAQNDIELTPSMLNWFLGNRSFNFFKVASYIRSHVRNDAVALDSERSLLEFTENALSNNIERQGVSSKKLLLDLMLHILSVKESLQKDCQIFLNAYVEIEVSALDIQNLQELVRKTYFLENKIATESIDTVLMQLLNIQKESVVMLCTYYFMLLKIKANDEISLINWLSDQTSVDELYMVLFDELFDDLPLNEQGERYDVDEIMQKIFIRRVLGKLKDRLTIIESAPNGSVSQEFVRELDFSISRYAGALFSGVPSSICLSVDNDLHRLDR